MGLPEKEYIKVADCMSLLVNRSARLNWVKNAKAVSAMYASPPRACYLQRPCIFTCHSKLEPFSHLVVLLSDPSCRQSRNKEIPR